MGAAPDSEVNEPIFNVPGAVLFILALMAGVHAVRGVLSVETDEWLVLLMAFIPARYIGLAAELPGGALASVTSFVTHAFVHGNLFHLLFNSAWLLAFGGAIAKRVGGLRFVLLFCFTAICGALFFLVVNWGLFLPVVGASGAISGLMGATFRFLFSALDWGGVRGLQEGRGGVPLPPLADALRDRRIVLAIAIWLGLNGLAAVGLGTSDVPGAIAWEAHIGGFLGGFFCFSFFDVQVRNEDGAHPPLQ